MDKRSNLYLDFTSEALYMYYRYIIPGGIMKNVDISAVATTERAIKRDFIRRNIVLRFPGEDYHAKVFALKAIPSTTSAGLYDLIMYSNESNTSTVYPTRDYPDDYDAEVERLVTGPNAVNPVMVIKLS